MATILVVLLPTIRSRSTSADFLVFAGFMMVEKFGFQVHEVTALYLINLLANIILAPLMGHAMARWDERNALILECVGLIGVFLAYSGVYYFGWGIVLAATLYIVDHIFWPCTRAENVFSKNC